MTVEPAIGGLEFRAAREEDQDAIAEILLAAGYSEDSAFAAIMSGVAVVATEFGRVIGFACSSGSDGVPILDIAVREEHLRRGIGRKLIEFLRSEAIDGHLCTELSFDEEDWPVESIDFARAVGFRRSKGSAIWRL